MRFDWNESENCHRKIARALCIRALAILWSDMRTLKYSRQREAIKAFLEDNHNHPTADEIYGEMRREFPNVSLGTVYRNLNLLVDCGEIRKLSFPSGPDHFDCVTTPHYHFVCRHCGKVYDMPDNFSEVIGAAAAKDAPGQIDAHDLVFYGICNECLKGRLQ